MLSFLSIFLFFQIFFLFLLRIKICHNHMDFLKRKRLNEASPAKARQKKPPDRSSFPDDPMAMLRKVKGIRGRTPAVAQSSGMPYPGTVKRPIMMLWRASDR
jgi:hypothetical protein